MDYLIFNRESFKKGMNRVLTGCRDEAADALRHPDDPHEAVHKARRSLKMLRAGLRLLRDELGEELFHQENSFYRDAARELSLLRDLSSMLHTLDDRLEKPFAKKYKVPFPAVLRQFLEQERALQLKKTSRAFHGLAGSLEDHAIVTQRLEWSGGYRENMLRSLERVYTRGQERCAENLEAPTPAAIHQWRKRAKYLRYQLRLLHRAWQPVLSVHEKQLHRLTDYLGNHNDLTVLLKYVGEHETGLGDKEAEKLAEMAGHMQRNLLKKARALGQKLYAEKPSAFTERMGAYLEGWPPLSNT